MHPKHEQHREIGCRLSLEMFPESPGGRAHSRFSVKEPTGLRAYDSRNDQP